MKKYFILFAVGLLACAGSREIDICDDDPGSPMMIWLGDDTSLSSESQINLPPDSSLTWVDESIGEIYGFRAPTQTNNGGFIINAPYRMSAKDSTLLAALLNDPAPDKIADERNAQKFSVRVNIAFPRMTLQQAAELEARLKKLLPEAQEINLDLGQDVEVPVDEFYWTPNTGQGLKLKVDSTDTIIWQEF